MALIMRGVTECSLCGSVLEKNAEIVATSHFIHDENDPLWRFSDSGMHRECFLNWEHREVFVRRFNLSLGKTIWGNSMRHRMDEAGEIHTERADE